MASVVYSRQASADMLDIWLWVAEANDPGVADAVIDRIERRVAMLKEYPEMGPARLEIAEGARAVVCERWLVLYYVVGADVRVVRIVDGSRD